MSIFFQNQNFQNYDTFLWPVCVTLYSRIMTLVTWLPQKSQQEDPKIVHPNQTCLKIKMCWILTIFFFSLLLPIIFLKKSVKLRIKKMLA